MTPCSASKRNGNFRTLPQFQVRIEGVGLPRDVLRDVMQPDLQGQHQGHRQLRDHGQQLGCRPPLQVRRPASTPEAQGNPASRTDRIFDPCKEPSSHMGYLDDMLTLMVRGNFTTLEPNFPAAAHRR